MRGIAAAAASLLTVRRTSSEPARASDMTWATEESTSAVSVLVIDCTTIGAVPPTVTEPTLTAMDCRREIIAAVYATASLGVDGKTLDNAAHVHSIPVSELPARGARVCVPKGRARRGGAAEDPRRARDSRQGR